MFFYKYCIIGDIMKYVTKSTLNQVEIEDINIGLPDLKNTKESKVI